MNAPQHPRGPSSPDDEQDPTGVRALLSSLPDPGPMPDDVMIRIQAALVREQEARGGAADNVTPLLGRPSAVKADGATPLKSSGRRRWLAPVAAAGVAAAIGIGAVAAVQMNNKDDAPTAAVPSSRGSAPSSDGGSDLPGLPAGLQDKVSIHNSNANYTQAGLAQEAGAMNTKYVLDPVQSEQPGIGPIGTRIGLLSCMKAIGGDLLDNPDKVVADLGTFEGKPAVIIVVTKDDKRTAWVVARDCTSGDAKMAGPTAVTSA